MWMEDGLAGKAIAMLTTCRLKGVTYMNDETVKISILVPIYNVEDYLKSCIESIVGQSYRNLEIILVDDGSTDRCPEICDDYAKKDKRICVIHKCNGGVNSARKAGTVAATGDYVLGVDGDDWIEQDRIEVLVKEGILPTHADMIHLSGVIKDFEDEEKESIHQNFNVPVKLFKNEEIESEVFPLMAGEGEAFNRVLTGPLWSWAIRRELLLKNQMLVDDRALFGQDFLCVCFCLLEAKSVMTLKQSGYHYIQRASSRGHQMLTISDENRLLLKILYQVLKNHLDQKNVSEKIRKMCVHIIMGYLVGFDYDLLLQKSPDYLFPFPNVSSGTRIVVYGAGRIGYRLVQHLDKTRKCSVVLWVDQNQNLPTVPGYTISSRDAIFSADYDFIVVAISKATVAKEVKCSLILDGIPEEKIATMDASVISEDVIPDEIRNYKLQ